MTQYLYHLNPLQEFQNLHTQMNRMFGAFTDKNSLTPFPLFNMWTNEEGVVITAELPGVPKDSINISLHQKNLTVSGKREISFVEEDQEDPSKNRLLHRERNQKDSFQRTLSLPFNVDPDHVSARSEAGVLVISLPRPHAEKPKQITITTS